MSLEAFLRANPMTFKLEGRIVYLVDRDGEKWQPPKKDTPAGGTDAGHPERSKGQGKGKEAKGRGGDRRGKAMSKGDPHLAKGDGGGGGKGKGSRGQLQGDEWHSWNSDGHWAPSWDEWDEWEWQAEPDWKASRWKASW